MCEARKCSVPLAMGWPELNEQSMNKIYFNANNLASGTLISISDDSFDDILLKEFLCVTCDIIRLPARPTPGT